MSCEKEIHGQLSKAIPLQEVKTRLIKEIDSLLANKESFNQRAPIVQKYFIRLEELRQGDWLNTECYLLESDGLLERINTEVMQSKISYAQDQGMAKLNCSYGGLTRFPKAVLIRADNAAFWAKLTDLNLIGNKLQGLPAHIGQLVALQGLYLDSNQLRSLPEEIGQLVALQDLSLRSNQLQNLPKEMGQLRALQRLHLNSNQLQSLPEKIGQLVALQGLDLGCNHLQSLPAQIGQLEALQGLSLRSNQLQSLPAQIGQLVALQGFDLGCNHLQSLPKEIGQLVALQELNLSSNQLQSLPAEIGRLGALRELYLAHNRLQSLPDELNENVLTYINPDHGYEKTNKATILSLQQPIHENEIKESPTKKKTL